MWLLNANTGRLEHFISDNVAPAYVILSHTWDNDEVSFQDMQHDEQVPRHKAGFKKLEYMCSQALSDGVDYVWVDTCCIDKRSSSELSEAINSMFAWYREAVCCYVYMTDVSGECVDLADDDDPEDELRGVRPGLGEIHEQPRVEALAKLLAFRRSRWFTRGWTLQELLAPSSIVFRNRDWGCIGHLTDLALTVADASTVDFDVLIHSRPLSDCSAAEKFSWASMRSTTREEDEAYCLLGIFDINMPLLYGERSKAFHRLQERLFQTSKDRSILAWDRGCPRMHFSISDGRAHLKDSKPLDHSLLIAKRAKPLLTSSPSAYADCALVRLDSGLRVIQLALDWHRAGLRARLPLIPIFGKETRASLCLIGCTEEGDDGRSIALLLSTVAVHNSDGVHSVRMVAWVICVAIVDCTDIDISKLSLTEFTLLLRGESPTNSGTRGKNVEVTAVQAERYRITFDQPTRHKLTRGHPPRAWNLRAGLLSLKPEDSFVMAACEASEQRRQVLIIMASSADESGKKCRLFALVAGMDWDPALGILLEEVENHGRIRCEDPSSDVPFLFSRHPSVYFPGSGRLSLKVMPSATDGELNAIEMRFTHDG